MTLRAANTSLFPIIFACLLAGSLGILVSFVGGDLFLIGMILSIALLPLLLIIIQQSPEAAVFLVFVSQPLEGYEIPTPVGNISVGIILVALTIMFWNRDIFVALSDPFVRPWLFLIIAYVLIHLLQFSDNSLSIVLRSLVTLSSYAAFWILGAWIGYRRLLNHAARASVLAIIVMGLLGLGVALGYVPETTRVGQVRQILGFESPLVRSYGTDLPFDATAFLAALALPFLILPLFFGYLSHTAKIRRALLFLVVAAFFFLTFQSRNMVLQVLAALGVAMFMRAGALSRYIIAVTGTFIGIRWVWPSIYGDATVSVSSDLRVYGLELGIDIMRNSSEWILGGISQSRIFDLYAERYPLVLAAGLRQGHQAIHNLILNEFVNAGLFAGLLLCGILSIAAAFLLYLNRTVVAETDKYYSKYLITASCLAAIVILIEPVSSNALGLWALLGMIFGYRGFVRRSSE